jgi:molybdopterin-guanine dinucleotide biosynthesis protein B
MRILGVAGWKGSGKTTLIVRLIPELIGRGLTASTVKHIHHNIAIDKADEDARALRKAGAAEVIVFSEKRWALMHELRGTPEPSLEELVSRMTPVDLLLVEGFKRYTHDKLEVHRRASGNPLLCGQDPHVVAVASDGPLPQVKLPVLDLNDVPAIADFVVSYCRLRGA